MVTFLFLSFLYVCPEPVLVKCSFLYINGAKRRIPTTLRFFEDRSCQRKKSVRFAPRWRSFRGNVLPRQAQGGQSSHNTHVPVLTKRAECLWVVDVGSRTRSSTSRPPTTKPWVRTNLAVPCRAAPRCAVPCRALPCPVLSCPVLSCPVQSRPVLPGLVPNCEVLSECCDQCEQDSLLRYLPHLMAMVARQRYSPRDKFSQH
jgi:hypothetical protein